MDLPERPDAKPPKGGWFSLLLAAGVGIMILAALVMLTGGYLGLVIVVGGGVFAMAAFHYLVWGWWLSEKLQREEAEAERQSAELARQRAELPAASKTVTTQFWLIFWGLAISMISIRINGYVLPNTGVGYAMIAWGCRGLAGESDHFTVAEIFAWIIAALWLFGLFIALPMQADGSRETAFFLALVYSLLACGVVWEMLGGLRDFVLARSRPDLAAKATNRRIAYAVVTIGCLLAAKLWLYDHQSLPIFVVVAGGLIAGVMILQLIYRVERELT